MPLPSLNTYRFAGAAFAGVMLVSLVACAGGVTADSTDGGSATSGTIDWWGWVPEAALAPQYIEAFNEEFPDITVNFKSITIDGYQSALRPALASSTGPDVYDIASGAMFEQYKDFGIDLTPAVQDALGDDWSDQLSPIGIESFTDDDQLKVVPVGLGFAGPIWINKDIFDEYSLTPPTDFAEWKKVCEVLSAQGVGCFTHGASQVAFNQDALQAIADTIEPGLFTKATEGEAKWTDPKLVEAFAAWQSLFDDGIMQAGALGQQQYPDANNDFVSGKSAMVMMGYWYSQYTNTDLMTAAIGASGVAEVEPFTALPIPFPSALPGGEPGALFGSPDYGLAVNATSDARNAATTFAMWLATARSGQQIVADSLADVPSLKGITPEFHDLVNDAEQAPALEALIEQAGTVTEGRLLSNAELADAIGVASTTLASGDATPEEAAAALQQAAEAAGVEY